MSTDMEKFFEYAQEKYHLAKKLLDTSGIVTTNELYKSKYEAKEILESINVLCKIQTELGKLTCDQMTEIEQITIVSALLHYEIGLIAIQINEPVDAENLINEAWDIIIKTHAFDLNSRVLAISILKELGILWAGRKVVKTKNYLKQAKFIYKESKFGKNLHPTAFDDLFLSKFQKEAKTGLTSTPLSDLLAYIRRDDHGLIHFCLNQGETLNFLHGRDLAERSMSCVMLLQEFIKNDDFSKAVFHIDIACKMLDKHQESLNSEVQDKNDRKWKELPQKKAYISFCWAKYAAKFLITSGVKKDVSEITVAEAEENVRSSDVGNVYELFKEGKHDEFLIGMTKFVTNYEEARALFLFGQEQAKLALAIFEGREFMFDYVNLIQINSNLYEGLLFFETDNERKCKMHKRQIDMLEKALKDLNSKFYFTHYWEQKIVFELAENYRKMMQLKCIIYNPEKIALIRISIDKKNKINSLCSKSIEYYKSFIDSFKDEKERLPEEFSDDVAKRVLKVHFYLHSLHTSFLINDPVTEITNTRKARKFEQFVMNYIEENPDQDYVLKEVFAIDYSITANTT